MLLTGSLAGLGNMDLGFPMFDGTNEIGDPPSGTRDADRPPYGGKARGR
jgi:hypothetical protein